MSRNWSHLYSAEKIIGAYEGTIPFSAWLKNYFKQNKKFGSSDRRNIQQLCFGYFRLGKSFADLTIQEKIITGYFLTANDSSFIAEIKPGREAYINRSLPEKLKLLHAEDEIINIFPLPKLLSPEMDSQAFSLSHIVQPLMFLRLRPGKSGIVKHQLTDHGIEFDETRNDCLAMEGGIRVERILQLNRDAVIQDLNSQNTIALLKGRMPADQKFSVWDCCAASGGKSILSKDLFPNIELTVSDIRDTIIANLKKRFAEAGITHYKSFVADVASDAFHHNKKYDLVICDAPCSGSGTWGRTPEQLSFFREEQILYYTSLQKKIALNVARQVNNGGFLLYITCSVFQAENEDVVGYLLKNSDLTLVESNYLIGYNKRADSLFGALFRRN